MSDNARTTKTNQADQADQADVEFYLSTPGPQESAIASGKKTHIASGLRPVPAFLHPLLPLLTDTHNHMCGFTSEEQECFSQRMENGCFLAKEYFLMSTSPIDWPTFQKLQSRNQQRFRFSFGVHPMNAETVDSAFPGWLDAMRHCLESSPQSIVGEIGLDKTTRHKKFYLSHQIAVFLAQFRLAAEFRRPVSLHSVKTDAGLIDILSTEEILPPTLSLHSFCGSPETLLRIIHIAESKSCRIFVGLNATTNLTKKNLFQYLETVGMERMIVETDWSCADYSYDGSNDQDTGKLLLHAIDMMAKCLGLDPTIVAESTAKNVQSFLQPVDRGVY